MARAVGRLLSAAFSILTIVLFIIGMATQNIGVLILASFTALGMTLLQALSSEERNFIYIFFIITFFIFLQSRVFVRWLENREIYSPFSEDVMMMTYSCLIVSFFGLTSGSVLKKRIKIGNMGGYDPRLEEQDLSNGGRLNIVLIRQLSGIFTVVSGFATLATVIERAAFWGISGYGGDLRTSFASTLPDIILRFSYVYVMMLCIYLATMPDKKRCLPILVQYLVVSALRMLYGSRVNFVIGLMFILVYFMIRDRLNDEAGVRETRWLGRAEKIFTLVSIPVLLILLVFVGYYRTHNAFQFSGLFDTLGEFFESQGTSINVISYTNIYKERFTQPKFLYLFDRTYEFLTTNPIGSLITGRHAYAANTLERAKYGTSLGMTLYYNINSVSYFAGNGCGSSYVAEAWLGYGYVGLYIVNFILARVMKRLNEFRFNRFVPSVFALLYIQTLFILPRDSFDAFVDDFASMTHIFAALVLWVTYKLILQRMGR